jgi:putative inorganic carbon (hco3(-)) transporter
MATAERAITRFEVVKASAVLLLALLTGAFAVHSTQLAVAIVLAVLLIAVRAQSRTAGLMTLWGYWLLMPLVRRMIELTAPAQANDPLSLLPFLATAGLALAELRSNRLDRRAQQILMAATGGFLLGVPAGFLVDPAAASFAALAYIAGLSAFVLGWGDEVRLRPGSISTLERMLAVALPILAVYGIVQYFFALSPWDAQWVAGGQLGSVGAPQEGHVRVFSTLNAPFTFAILLSLGVFLGLSANRRSPVRQLVVLLFVVALALTFVRSAWLALVVGLIIYLASNRGSGAGRTVAVVVACVVAVVILGGSNPTTKAFTNRITSLGDPEADVSAQDRLAVTNRLLPTAVSQPLGAGLGQTGLSSRLGETTESGLVEVDDGYLSLLYQSGPLGLLLVLAAMIAGVVAAVQALGRAPPEAHLRRVALLAGLVTLIVAEASADALFGFTGAVFWCFCGLSVAAASRERELTAARAASAASAASS